MSDEDERVSVSTYVPAYQRDSWQADADRLDMSQSEFVRTMVQAGRRGFDLCGGESAGPENPVEPHLQDGPPRGDGLKKRIEEVLGERGPLEWDALVDAIADDVEDRVEGALSDLQDDNRVKHRGRQGGYDLVGEADGD